MKLLSYIASAVLLAISTAASGGILSPPNVTCDVGGDAGSGLVIASATIPDSNHPFAPKDLSVWFGPHGEPRKSSKLFLSRQRFLVHVPSDFDGVYGQLFALKLPAGDYDVYGWYYTDLIGDRQTQPARRLETLPFRIQAGRATYIGSFLTQFWGGHTGIIRYPVGAGWVRIVDEHERDLSVFTQKCRGFSAEQVDTQVFDSASWTPTPAEERNFTSH